MNSLKMPNSLSVYMFLLALGLLSWTSCREVGSMSGGNGGVPRESTEILRVCYDGWTENPTTQECECPSPNVVVGQYECRTVEPEDWYSNMSGCLVDQGILFQVEGPVHPDSVNSFSRKHVYIEMPDTVSRQKVIHLGLIRFLPRGERFDSVQFYVPSSASLPYYDWPTVGYDGYNTGFHGIILNDSTLVGQFVFGPMRDPWELNRNLIFSECEAIIRKGRVE